LQGQFGKFIFNRNPQPLGLLVEERAGAGGDRKSVV
jgi:hypothetical protein